MEDKGSTIGERMEMVRNHFDLNIEEFCKKLGISKVSYNNYLSGKYEPGFKVLSHMVQEFPDISKNWLILGEGDMIEEYIPKSKLNETERKVYKMKSIIEYLEDKMEKYEPKTKGAKEANGIS